MLVNHWNQIMFKFRLVSKLLRKPEKHINLFLIFIIDCIPDMPTESWDESQRKAKKLFADHLKMDPKLVEIEWAHRMGTYTANGWPRPVIVKLLRYKDKEEIFKQAKKLTGTNFFINEDFSERVRQGRKELLPQLLKHVSKGTLPFSSMTS